MTCGAGRLVRTLVLAFRASVFGAGPVGSGSDGTTGAPGVPGAGGKVGCGGVSLPFGSVISGVEWARSVGAGGALTGGGSDDGGGGITAPPATGGVVPGSGRSVIPPAPITFESVVGLVATVATVVPATGELASPVCPATSVRATRTVSGPLSVTLNWVVPSASGRVWTGVQVD